MLIFRLPVDVVTGLIKPGIEYLRRDPEVLLSEVEWSWATLKDQAFVFPDMDDADRKLAELVVDGVKHAHTMTFTRQCEQERSERSAGRRPAEDAWPEKPRVSSSQCFENLERQGLA